LVWEVVGRKRRRRMVMDIEVRIIIRRAIPESNILGGAMQNMIPTKTRRMELHHRKFDPRKPRAKHHPRMTYKKKKKRPASQ